MNRDEAIELLQSGPAGVIKWNQQRTDTTTSKSLGRDGADLEMVDLCGADLSGVDLSEANLNNINLSRANLFGSRLIFAKLIGADLMGSDLRHANLSRANCTRANLIGAYLREVDLSLSVLGWAQLNGADLSGAKFSRAYLSGADLTNAKSGDTLWTNIDLSEAKGLEEVRHIGPSTVDVTTLFKSKGKIPDTFLRGCGVPENLIEYLPSLIGSMQPIQFYSCFLSHSSQDKEFCRRVYARMRQEKLRVWFDEEDMPWGKKLHDVLDVTIKEYDKLLLVLSEHSMNSEWVKTEIYHARQKELKEKRQVLFPIRLCSFQAIRDWKYPDADTGKDLAREIREYYIPGDFEHWKDHDKFETAFAKLMDGLRASATV